MKFQVSGLMEFQFSATVEASSEEEAARILLDNVDYSDLLEGETMPEVHITEVVPVVSKPKGEASP